MTHEEAVEILEVAKTKYFGEIRMAFEVAINALKANEAQELPDYPICERCGKQIDHINTSVFNYDGSDSEHRIPIYFDKPSGCVVFETTRNWTGYELTDEERKEHIRCPHCDEYPFDKGCEIEFNEPVIVLMWTSSPTMQMEAVKWDDFRDR